MGQLFADLLQIFSEDGLEFVFSGGGGISRYYKVQNREKTKQWYKFNFEISCK